MSAGDDRPGGDGLAEVHDISDAASAAVSGPSAAAPGPGSGPVGARVPEHVAAAFQAGEAADARPLGPAWDNGWLIGQTVLSRAVGPHTTWSARVRERLRVPGLQVVRPVRATDGRFLSAGWRAEQYVPGEPAARVDETAAAALRLEDALADAVAAGAPRPEADLDDVFCLADRAAWAEHTPRVLDSVEDGLHKDLLARLRAATRGLDGPAVPGHADMLATTVFAPNRAPAVTDLVGVLHPRGYTAAQVVVDGLLAGAVDAGVIGRFRHVPQFSQLLVRAAAYRVWAHVLLDDPEPNASSHLAEVVDLVVSHPSGSL